MRIAAILVVAIGLFEFAFPSEFTKVFDIAKFYIERGSMEAAPAQQSSNLLISGMRPAGLGGGRNLLPFLSDHCVSSIFLEPVSAGNFGTIVFLWALVRSRQTRRFYWGLFAAAATMIILSDSRFGAFFCIICTVLTLLPVAIGSLVAALLPAVGLVILIVLPGALGEGVSNGFVGRVVLSGQLLARMTFENWLGIKSPDFFAFDSGYTYMRGGIGILGAVDFCLMLWSVPAPSWQFKVFRNLAGAYYAVLLCISNSPFTIKTASLLWFLVGVLSRDRAQLTERALAGK